MGKSHKAGKEAIGRTMRLYRSCAPRKPRCPACLIGGYTEQPHPVDGRPYFTCSCCGHDWADGVDGGAYVSKTKTATLTGCRDRQQPIGKKG